jgi:serine/threonine protein phosphatase PrpC
MDGYNQKKISIVALIFYFLLIILATDGVGDPKHQSALMQMERLIEMVEKGAGAEDLVHDAIQRCTNDNATAIVARVNF